MLANGADAERDLEELKKYVEASQRRAHADCLLHFQLAQVQLLSRLPQRGAVPKKVEALAIPEYRQVFGETNRLIYRIIGERIRFCLIVDGRRDLHFLFFRRLRGREAR